MKLETKRLILREPKTSDWKDIFDGISDFEISRWLSRVPYPYKRKDAEDFIKGMIKKWETKNSDEYVFFIELKSEKKVIGVIGIHKINRFSGTGDSGSWVNRKYWRNGYMTEAKIAFNDFVFNKLKLRKIRSSVYRENKASNATQIKVGYKLEGMQRKNTKCRASGKIHDSYMYGLLKEDWKKARPKLIKII